MSDTAFDTSTLNELRMVLLGSPGVGKSATGNVILGREAFRETETTECEIQRGTVDGRNISVIDTPGINNTTLSADQLSRTILLSSPGPHVFLLEIRVGTFTEEERNTVQWIQENFGEEVLRFTMVLFTGREEIPNRQWKTFSEKKQVQEFTGQCGGGYVVINGKREANSHQITKLLKKINIMIQQNEGHHYTHKGPKCSNVEKERRRQEEEERRKLEEQIKRLEDDRRRQEEEERRKLEEEIKRLEDDRRRQEEEERRRLEEERRRLEEERMRLEEEIKRLEDDRRRQEEEEIKRLEDDRRRQEEEQIKRLEDDRRRQEEEEQRRLEEERMRLEEESVRQKEEEWSKYVGVGVFLLSIFFLFSR